MRGFFVLLISLTPFLLFAQKNFKPGYIVNLKGDTTKGFINYKEWDSNPTSILFKSSGTDDNERVYKVNDIGYFEITGYEAYLWAVVDISLDPTNFSGISAKDTSSKTDTVFLKVIYMGDVASLLSYSDHIKQRFYVLETGQPTAKELMFRTYFKDGLTLVTEDIYRSQLTTLMSAYNPASGKLAQKIKEANYEKQDLKKVFMLMNHAEEGGKAKGNKHPGVGWFAGIGMQKDNVKFEGNHRFARGPVSSELSWLPKFSAGVDVFANPNIGKLFLRVEAGFQKNQSTFTRYGDPIMDFSKASYEVASTSFSIVPQLNYTVYNTAKVKIPVGIGCGFNFLNYSKNQYVELDFLGNENDHDDNYLDLRKTMGIMLGRISVVFQNKIEASFLYHPFASQNTALGYSMSTSNMQFQVYYLFRKKNPIK
jgi:hypothetical protein